METALRNLRLGMIGQSEGNGHPWSWSAIVNGYDREAMQACPFPAIPRYLVEREFPQERLHGAQVTHVWTQDNEMSEQIAAACLIDNIVEDMSDMIGEVDAVVLARDDHERHFEMSAPFLRAGLPVFIDKPMATTVAECERIWGEERYPGQVFTCSALRFAREFEVSDATMHQLGRLAYVEAGVPKSWDLYAVHVIEPVLLMLGDQGKVLRSTRSDDRGRCEVRVEWENGLYCTFSASGTATAPIEITLVGGKGSLKLTFADTFSAFKRALDAFTQTVRTRNNPIERSFVLKVVEVIEAGNREN